MKVGFDARDVLRPRTGVVNHTRHLLDALIETRSEHSIVGYVDRQPGARQSDSPPLRAVPGVPVFWKHGSLPIALAFDRVDVFHSPSGTLPLWCPCATVVTVHDLFAEIEPAWFPLAVGLQLRQTIRRACRTARCVIAVSEATRQDVMRYYGVPRERITVVPNGVGRAYRPADDLAAQQEVRRRYADGRPFVLYVGTRFPWRNVTRLIEAFRALKQRGSLSEQHLVLVGRDIWGTDTSRALVERLGLSSVVHFAGYAPPEDLPVLYRAAEVLAYPSLYEGFGIPPLEAMASGTPVVTSTRGGLAEVVGDAAVLVDPECMESIADGLDRALTDAELRRRLRAAGLERSSQFTWQTAALRTWKVYKAALGG